MQTMQLKNASAKYTENSLLTFLKGNCNENWVVGVLKASMPEDIELALNNLSFYNNTPRFEFLKKSCGIA